MAKTAKPFSSVVWDYLVSEGGEFRLHESARADLRRRGLAGLEIEAAISHLVRKGAAVIKHDNRGLYLQSRAFAERARSQQASRPAFAV